MALSFIHLSHSEAWGHPCLCFLPSSHILSFLHPKCFSNICTLSPLFYHSLRKTKLPFPAAWTTAVAPVVFLPHHSCPPSTVPSMGFPLPLKQNFKWATRSFSVWLWITTQSVSFLGLFPLHSSHSDPLSVSPALMLPLITGSVPMLFPLPEIHFPPWYISLGFIHPSGHCSSIISPKKPPATSLTCSNLPILGS